MKCYISGSHGFIGEHLSKQLEHLGHTVHRVRRNFTIEDPTDAYIFHLAAHGNYHHQDDNEEMIYTNVGKLYNLLDYIKDYNFKAFINFSTSSVMLPHQTFYSASKASGEYICKAFAHTYKKPIISVRPFTVIGPGEQKDHLIPTIIRSFLNNKPVTVSPDAVHDYIDVRDVVSYVIRKSQKLLLYEYGHVFEMGSGKEITNYEIACRIEDYMNTLCGIKKTGDKRPYDVTEGWSATNPLPRKYTLDQTLMDMIAYEKQKT